jgi:AsmA protein
MGFSRNRPSFCAPRPRQAGTHGHHAAEHEVEGILARRPPAWDDLWPRDFGMRVVKIAWLVFRLTPSLQIGKIALLDDGDRARRRLTAERVRIDAAASSLLSGKPRLSEITVVRPTFFVPLVRERAASSPARDSAGAKDKPDVTIERLVIEDGTIVFADEKDSVTARLDHVEGTATTAPDDMTTVRATARAGERTLGISVKGKLPGIRFDERSIPLEFTIEAPGLLADAVPGTAELKAKGPAP